MIGYLAKFKVNGSVLAIEESQDEVIVVDNLYYVYSLNKNYQFNKTISLSKTHEPFHKYAKSMGASKSGFINVPLLKTSKSAVLKSGETIQKVSVISWHKADISCSVFSDNSKLLATGGEDGRTNIFSVPSFGFVTSLFPKPDYVSAIAFSYDSTLVATASYDKSISIFDLDRNLEICEFFASDIAEGLFFIGKNRVFYACKDGTTGLFSISDKKIINETKHIEAWLTDTAAISSSFAVVSTKDNKIALIRTSDNKLFKFIELDKTGITKLKYTDGKLYIGFTDGGISVVDCKKYQDELEVQLGLNEYAKAKELTDKNIFLKTLPIYIDKLNEGWKDVLQQAIDLIAKNGIQEAINIVAPFVDDPTKGEEFTFYMSQRDYIGKFLDALEAKNIPEAYALSEQYKEIKSLSAYQTLEEYWLKIFDASKKLLAANPQLNLQKAQELLKVFINVKSKKDQVYSLLRNADKHMAADKALKERDFAGYFRITEKFTFLKETETYRKAIVVGDQLLDKMTTLENGRDFNKALEVAKILSNMIPFRNSALERSKDIERKVSFYETLEAKDIEKAYAMLETYPALKALPEYTELSEEFRKISDKAYEQAFAGDIAAVLKTLEGYLTINFWSEKIGAVMKTAYLNEIKNNFARDKETIDWNRTLEDFINYFGKGDELHKVCEGGKLQIILDEIQSDGDKLGYKKLAYLTTIIAKCSK